MDKAHPVSLPIHSGGTALVGDYRHGSLGGDSGSDNPATTDTTVAAAGKSSSYSPKQTDQASSSIDEDGKATTTTCSSSNKTNPGGAPSRIRRRNRMITSCLECRRRKLKCDKSHPCTNCSKFSRDCVFLAPALDNVSRMKLTDLKEKMGSLERVLEQDVAGRSTGGSGGEESGAEHANRDSKSAVTAGNQGTAIGDRGYEDAPVPEDEAHLEPTRMAVQDAAYEDEADDDTVDLGLRLGKMRLTDRIGGLFRPKITDELTQSLKKLSVNGKSAEEPDEPPKPPRLRDLLQAEKDAYFNPGPSYIAPHSEIIFGTESGKKYTLVDFLPSKFAADNLLQRYWLAVHPIAKVVHRQSFEKRYDSFWEDVSRGFEPAPSLQAIVFASMFSAVSSMSEEAVLSIFGVPQKNLIENFQLGTEMALGKSHFLRTTKTETLQAFVMYMIPMCRAEISRAHSTLVGAAIRLAECMGFHRDPSEYGLQPIETHVRRMIWYQLCFLDVRTSESQGPRPTIRREDFSTRFPLNVNDSDLQKSNADSLRDMPQWTDMTFTRIRFECCEFGRIIFHDNARLDRKAVSITHVLGKIESFRKACYAKYGPMINGPNQTPLQRTCGVVLTILMSRLYLAVLHRYHNSVAVRIPDRLRQIIITTGTQQLESGIELETSPELQTWAWYGGTYQQYHAAFLLLFEVWLHPMRREAERIWRCLDYIFEVPAAPGQSGPSTSTGRVVTRKDLVEHRAKKSTIILTQLRDRMSAYQEMRKAKAPVRMHGTSVYIRPLASGVGGDLMVRRADDIQGAEEANNAADRPEGQEPHSEPPNVSLGTKIPLTTFLSSSSDLPYPSHFPNTSQHLPTSQPLSYSYVQHQPHPHYQPQTQNHLPFSPPWQPQYQNPVPPSQHLSDGTASAIQPSAYGQQNYNNDTSRGQSLGSDTTNSDDSSGRLWFMSSTETLGAGAAPPAPARPPASPPADPMVLDIDWDEWDKLFPPEINTGDLNLPSQMEDQAISMDTSLDAFSSSNLAYYQQQWSQSPPDS